ncbi:MAG: prepilin-type N-terminal cleavage/methylation domain-containing protein [Planctomycetes bacterium]|nr:prepilin-type N-terminal cleavage/methylation domain-containing protein [Planctomycetota bacterium]
MLAPHVHPFRRHRGGFTLIETMMVLAVLGLLGALMMTNMDGVTQHERLRAAARKLAGMSDYLRSVAAGTKRACYLDIDFERSRYRFRQDPPQDPYGRFMDVDDGHLLEDPEVEGWREAQDWESLPSGVYFRRHWINAKQFYDKKSISVEYQPDGTLDSFILWLQSATDEDNKEGAWFSVQVNGLSGQSETHDYAAKFPDADESDFHQVMGNDAPGAGR